jgi:hypothetical protein
MVSYLIPSSLRYSKNRLRERVGNEVAKRPERGDERSEE